MALVDVHGSSNPSESDAEALFERGAQQLRRRTRAADTTVTVSGGVVLVVWQLWANERPMRCCDRPRRDAPHVWRFGAAKRRGPAHFEAIH